MLARAGPAREAACPVSIEPRSHARTGCAVQAASQCQHVGAEGEAGAAALVVMLSRIDVLRPLAMKVEQGDQGWSGAVLLNAALRDQHISVEAPSAPRYAVAAADCVALHAAWYSEEAWERTTDSKMACEDEASSI